MSQSERHSNIDSSWQITRLKDFKIAKNKELDQWQEKQLASFGETGFLPRKEEWKYTPISSLTKRAFLKRKIFKNSISAEPLFGPVYLIVFINGIFRPDLSDLNDLPKEVMVLDLAGALSQKVWPSAPQHQIQSEYQTPFSLLNDALFETGLFLKIPRGICVDRPFYFLSLTQGDTAHTMSHQRHFIIVEEDAKAVLFEEYRGDHACPYFNNVVSQVQVKTRGELFRYKFQREGNQAFHFGHWFSEQGAESTIHSYQVVTGGQLSRDELNFILDNKGSSCELIGFYGARGNGLIDHHTRVKHDASHSKSRQHYKGMIGEKARGVFEGRIVVQETTKEVKATQLNQNLLLSALASINAKPQLEIYTQDVECTHGATIGALDEAALFYLRSRGLNESTAKQILMTAFIQEILDQFHLPIVSQTLKTELMTWLDQTHE